MIILKILGLMKALLMIIIIKINNIRTNIINGNNNKIIIFISSRSQINNKNINNKYIYNKIIINTIKNLLIIINNNIFEIKI